MLSVVTPVLNGGRYFRSCVASVERLARALPGQIEHIIADGGSTDGTVSLAHALLVSPESPVSAVVEGPDRGQSHAINRGFSRARGRWLAWLNADDEYAPSASAVFGDVLAGAFDPAEVVVGGCRFVDGAGGVVFEPRPPDLSSAADMLRPLSKWFAGRCIVQPEAAFRREAFERVGGLDEGNHLAMDHDLWLRLLGAGATFATDTRQVAIQRVHAGQKTANNLGVARQILANCDRHVADHPDAGSQCSAELERLRGRIESVDRVLRSREGPAMVARDAVVDSLVVALASIRGSGRGALVFGDSAYRAVRAAGWDPAGVVRGAGDLSRGGGFDVVVVDCSSGASSGGAAERMLGAVGAGGCLVLGACTTAEGFARARRGIERALGDRVTRSGPPWSPEFLASARGVMGWLSKRPMHSDGLTPGLEVVRRVALRVDAAERGHFAALGVDPSDLVTTLELRRRSPNVQ